LLAVFVAACGSPPREDPWEPAAPGRGEGVVGWVDGEPVGYGDVGRYLRERDPIAFFRHLEGLLLERLTRAEAAPLGVTVDAAALERATRRRLAEWDQRVREAARAQTGREVEPALWLQRTAGISMLDFEAQVRRHTEVELLQDRLLRFEQLRSPRRELSLIVTADGTLARNLRERLDAGEDFATLARENSIHENAAEGGRLPHPLLPDDVADPAVRQTLFELEPGAVAGPFATDGPDGRAWFQLYRVETVGEPDSGPWERLRPHVVESLRKRPVDVAEYERWRRRILLRHGFVAATGPHGDNG
jgi:hypothetical protein